MGARGAYGTIDPWFTSSTSQIPPIPGWMIFAISTLRIGRPDLPEGKGLVIAEGVFVTQRLLTSRFEPISLLGVETTAPGAR